MKADHTRTTFNRNKHRSRVLMQQGRPQMDADWDEQVAIHHHYLRQLAADVIGPCGGPSSNLAFQVVDLANPPPRQMADFGLSGGHYYVDGILCEVDGTPIPVKVPDTTPWLKFKVGLWTVDGLSLAIGQYIELFEGAPDPATTPPDPIILHILDIDHAGMIVTVNASAQAFVKAKLPCIRRVATYLNQPDYVPPALAKGDYHVYLDVWERFIGHVEDDSIREVALGGPDTAARARVVWQVKVLAAQTDVCLTPQALRDKFQPPNLARLRARAEPSQTSEDPCTIAPDALYRGPENQCYRVEVHSGNADAGGNWTNATPTFKWSRESGDVVFPIRSGGGTNALVLESFGRDDRFGLTEGDWVEVQDDDYVLGNAADNLLQIQSIDRSSMTVVLAGTADASIGKFPAKHPLLRRWDHKEGDASQGGLTLAPDGAAKILPGDPNPGSWLDLEDGVQVQFTDPANTIYRTGDYWEIPARVATGDVEWPSETVAAGQGKGPTERVPLLPLGVAHHYAPLAVLSVDANNNVEVIHTCQSAFDALTAMVSAMHMQMMDRAAPTGALGIVPQEMMSAAANPVPAKAPVKATSKKAADPAPPDPPKPAAKS